MSQKKQTMKKLLSLFPRTFSEELGIDLASCREKEIFKWFLASLLFGARISTKTARKTYKQFETRGLVTPKAIQKADWNRLVEVLDEGGLMVDSYGTKWTLGGNHSEVVIVPEWMENLKGEVFICGAFDGECIEDLEIALKGANKEFKRVEHLIT